MLGERLVVTVRSQLSRRRPARVGVIALLAVVTSALASTPAAADRTVRLRAMFEGQQATATFSVPDDWKSETRTTAVKLTAPSSRAGCDHLLRLDVNMLYVAPTVRAADWVASRLLAAGSLVAGAAGEYSWGVATRRGARTSTGAAARAAGTGRYGQIMSEVRSSADVSRDCPSVQGARAAKRLARVIQGIALSTAKRRR
jgi:hypothetical protein